MIGSAICTGAPTSSFGVLLLGRAIQGVGAAGVNISVHTILADRVSLNDFAFNWTIFALIGGVSFGVGPVLGGFLTQANWRWCFAINLPVAVVAIVLVVVLLRGELLGPQPLPELENRRDTSTRHGRFLARIATIDYGGQLLFLWGIGLLILALTWAGGTYAWDSVAVLVPLVLGAVLSLAWILYEYLMAPPHAMSRVFPSQRAMIPWELLTQRDVGILFILNFAVGMAMFSVLYFMDIYFSLVRGNSPSKAALSLLFYLPGLGGMFAFPLSTIRLHNGEKGPVTNIVLNVDSWCLRRHVLLQRLAPPDASNSRVREHRLRRWHHSPGEGDR